jgi:UTP--glucose-1-phosphate uridylyltransferase
VITEFDKRFPEGAPSMKKATSLTVDGDFTFGAHVQVVGDVELTTDAAERIAADTVLIGDAAE